LALAQQTIGGGNSMRNTMRLLAFLSLGGLLALGGCIAGFGLMQTIAVRQSMLPPTLPPDAHITETAVMTAVQAILDRETQIAPTYWAITGGLLYEDPQVHTDFTDSSEGYVIQNAQTADDGLMIINRASGDTIWTFTDQDFPSDVDLSTTAQGIPPAPCDHWNYGIMARVPPDSRVEPYGFYMLQAWSYKHWYFVYAFPSHMSDSVTLAEGDLPADFDMMQPTVFRIVAKGDQFKLYINSVQIGSVTDSGRPIQERNMAGFSVFNCVQGGTVRFTNLVVRVPQ
jgi:hypothetical protein